jgi:hypothetical protein
MAERRKVLAFEDDIPSAAFWYPTVPHSGNWQVGATRTLTEYLETASIERGPRPKLLACGPEDGLACLEQRFL